MNCYKQFLSANKLKQRELADYLNVTESAISNIVTGKANLSEPNLIKLLENDKGWDVSMLNPPARFNSGNVNSVVNSRNFKYEKGGISAKDLLDVIKENQRQMGVLIDSIAVLSSKIK